MNARPNSSKLASRTLNDVQRLRREFELACVQVVGKGDSNSWLSFVSVLSRDKEFNRLWGLPTSRLWFAANKGEVPVPDLGPNGEWPADYAMPDGYDVWEINDALKTAAAATAATAAAAVEAGPAPPGLPTPPGLPAPPGEEAPVVCLDRLRYWELMGGSIVTPTDPLHPVIGATGNHVPVAGWYYDSYTNQLGDGIEVTEFCCGVKFSVTGEGAATTGSFAASENTADLAAKLCMEFQIGGTKNKKLNKESGIEGKLFQAEVRALISSRVGAGDFDMEVAHFAVGTPETLKYGLRYMAEQAASLRPKKRKKVSALGVAQTQNTKLFAMTTGATFMAHFSELPDKTSCIEEGTGFLGDLQVAVNIAEEALLETSSVSSSGSCKHKYRLDSGI